MSARILIIEDHPDNMELMAYLLKAFGHVPSSVFDGEAGIEAALREIPDLIVCDINLPKLDGYGVVRGIKSDAALRRIPVVAVTALAMVGDREKLLDAGFDGYVAKPIEPETFVAQIEKFLSPGLRSSYVHEASAATGESAPVAKANRIRILVVDDSPVNCELIRNTLEPFGYELSTSSNVSQGIERMQNESFDLVLSDLHMPDQNGIDFIRAVKNDPRLAAIPFLFISSSYQDDVSRLRSLELGAARFLRRPIEPQALIDEIEACLKR